MCHLLRLGGLLGVLMAMAGCQIAGQQPEGDILIKRDEWGTPHVYADSPYRLFYGYGYAIAQDRLFQLEMSRRTTQGRVAEVLGRDYLAFDEGIRRQYSPQAIARQLAALAPQELQILQGYAEGINRHLGEIEQRPDSVLPKQFSYYQFQPRPWTAFDVAMVYVGSMINRFGDYNTELDNQNLLAGLIEKHGLKGGQSLFELLLANDDPQAPTTIARGEWDPARRSAAVVPRTAGTAVEPPLPMRAVHPIDPSSGRGFSNIIVLGAKKSADARAILVNGPQFGFFQPAYTYSIGLHGAGYDAVGNSPFGYPLIQFGHNREISWGSTWGAGDNVDVYRLQLNPQNPNQYWFQGRYRDFERRVETIAVKGEAPRQLTVYRSAQGAVFEHLPEQGVAYARRRGWEGQELATLMAWNQVAKAGNHAQWLAQVERSAINVNWYYADQQGNIGYALGGRYPVRLQGHDSRLPMPGNGDYEWQGFLPFASNPQVFNPASGYIANWNNQPAEGFPGPDQWWYAWGAADRYAVLDERLRQQARFTPEQAWSLMMEAAFEDPNARYFMPRLLALSERLPAEFAAVHQALAAWDYQDLDRNRDGFYDQPATAIFRRWLGQMLDLTLADQLPPAQAGWFTDTGYSAPGASSPGSHNISVGTKVLYRALTAKEQGESLPFDLFKGHNVDELMLQALRLSVAQLKREQGPQVSAWRQGVSTLRFAHKNFLGVPQALQREEQALAPSMNLGTENNMVVLSEGKVSGFELAAPGQSGFIAADGSPGKHYDDQVPLLREQRKRRTWLSEDEIERHTVERLRLQL
ncbi:penicillin amidase [Pseudomonas sp. R32]|nr:penicillin amidase [Pseudomonas sp. R32]